MYTLTDAQTGKTQTITNGMACSIMRQRRMARGVTALVNTLYIPNWYDTPTNRTASEIWKAHGFKLNGCDEWIKSYPAGTDMQIARHNAQTKFDQVWQWKLPQWKKT